MAADAFVKSLAGGGHAAPSADNSQPWQFTWDGERLSIRYAFERVAGRTFPAYNPATLLAMGVLIENYSMVADDWDLDLEIEPLALTSPPRRVCSSKML